MNQPQKWTRLLGAPPAYPKVKHEEGACRNEPSPPASFGFHAPNFRGTHGNFRKTRRNLRKTHQLLKKTHQLLGETQQLLELMQQLLEETHRNFESEEFY
jgi:hypothetical protein